MTGTAELEQRALTVPEQARAIRIVDQASLDAANELLGTVRELRGDVNTTLDPIIAAAHKTHKEALAQKAKIEKPLVEAESALRILIAAYIREQERLRIEAERKTSEEAERLAREEQLAAAIEAEQAGAAPEEVDAILEESPLRVVVRTAPAVNVPKGLSTRDNWSAEVTDKMALIRHVAANAQFHNLLEPNIPALNSLARSLKSAMGLPGVRAVNNPTLAKRAV